jgi:linoleoyl-CoA desaturase
MALMSTKVHFTGGGSFQANLVQRVQAYFEDSARARHGGWAIAVKITVMLLWLVLSWALLMFAHPGPWLAALLAVSIGLAVAGVGFCVMHDANHGAAAPSARVNRLLSFSLDLLGASSALWRQKHNVLHHTYTNISGVDPDLEGGGVVLRLAPWQPRHPWHRYQRFYIWLVYALFPLKWWFIDDVRELAEGRVRGRELVTAIGGKILFVGWAFALPAVLHLSWGLVGIWAIALFTLGNVLAFVFQLAHCVGEADFVERGEVEGGWMRHQVATTVDFAPRNAVLSWYLGGLNFQVEHHLFARVCHVHYPALRRIVAETCREHAIPYRCQPSLWSALEANWRWLRELGAPTPA